VLKTSFFASQGQELEIVVYPRKKQNVKWSKPRGFTVVGAEDMTPAQVGWKSGECVTMEPLLPQNTVTIDPYSDDKIKDVKLEIQRRFGIFTSDFILRRGVVGRALRDEMTLNEENIEKEATLYLHPLEIRPDLSFRADNPLHYVSVEDAWRARVQLSSAEE